MRRALMWAAGALLVIGCGDEGSGEPEDDPAPSALLAPTEECPMEGPMDAQQAQTRLEALAICLGHAPGAVRIDCAERTVWYDWDEVVLAAEGGWVVGADFVFCEVAFRGGEVPPHDRLMGFALARHTIPATTVNGPLDGLPVVDGCPSPQRLPGAQAADVAAAYVEHLACLGYPAEQAAVYCWGPPTRMSDDGVGPSVLCRVEVPAEGVGFQGQVLVGASSE